MKNHSKGSMARLSVICIRKNNWHGKQQLVSVLLMTSRMVEPALPILDESKEFFRRKSCRLGTVGLTIREPCQKWLIFVGIYIHEFTIVAIIFRAPMFQIHPLMLVKKGQTTDSLHAFFIPGVLQL